MLENSATLQSVAKLPFFCTRAPRRFLHTAHATRGASRCELCDITMVQVELKKMLKPQEFFSYLTVFAMHLFSVLR